MSAKFISALGEDGSDLHKQIGCMTGIFQIFDRQHLVSGRRPPAHGQKRQHPGNISAETYGCSPRVGQDKNSSSMENRRLSMESSRNSFSSSSCSSSFSSLECNRSSQQEHSLYETSMYAELALKDLPKPHLLRGEKPNHATESSTNTPVKINQHPTDFRDIVKGSIHRETQGLLVKPVASEAYRDKPLMKLNDSPRLRELSKSEEGSYLTMASRKAPVVPEIDESASITSRLRARSHDLLEQRDLPRSSSAIIRDNLLSSLSKDARRFSYDGRDCARVSLDSRDSGCSASRLRDFPRLSLDSREFPLQQSDLHSSADSVARDSDRNFSQLKVGRGAMARDQAVREEQQSPSVVAKLMGLEAMPGNSYCSLDQMGSKAFNHGEISDAEDGRRLSNCSLNPSWAASPKSAVKVNIVAPKTVPHPKIPMETAPWKQPVKGRMSPRRAGLPETHAAQKHVSVYGEIQRKLKDLEFQPSNKDLRALKQILDAIHAKGLLEVKGKGEEHLLTELSSKKSHQWKTNFELDGSLSSGDLKRYHDARGVPNSSVPGTSTPRTWESPIVIMKPAKSFSGDIHDSASSGLECVIGLPKVRTSDATGSQDTCTDLQPGKDRTPKNLIREFSNHVQVIEKKSSERIIEDALHKALPRSSKVSSRQHNPSNEGGGGSVKSPSSSSPRMLQKKTAMEKRSCSSPTSDTSKQQKPLRQSPELVSPTSRPKGLSRPEKKIPENMCRSKSSSSRGGDVSQRLIGNSHRASHVDIGLARYGHSGQKSAFFHEGSSATRKVANGAASVGRRKKGNCLESCSYVDGVATTSEQPSPVSVLDGLVYNDELPGSPPVRGRLCASRAMQADNGNQSAEPIIRGRWNSMDLDNHCASEIGKTKLRNIENLVQKLEQLSSTDNQEPEANPIALLCETQNPNHHYISEILLASGLLLNNIDSGFPSIQLHQSGYPINPNFFLVLEQKKSRSLAKTEEPICQNAGKPEADLGRVRRRLTFDTVNEVLIRKFELDGGGPLPASWVRAGKLSKRVPCGQLLLKELCSEIEHLETDSLENGAGVCDEEADELKFILAKDITEQSEGWVGLGKEVTWLVLDIERLIFKDLIGEVVAGGAMLSQARKPSLRRRQLFA